MPTIEAEYTEQPYEPTTAGVSRGDVLTQARLLAAEAAGVAALVEGGLGRVRPDFLSAWRRW